MSGRTTNEDQRLLVSARLAAANGTRSRQCLDDVLIYGPRHLERVLPAYVAHYGRRDHIGD